MVFTLTQEDLKIISRAYGAPEAYDLDNNEPLYEHYCPSCKFLGSVHCEVPVDLYVCLADSRISTVLVRFSSSPPSYSSGIELAEEVLSGISVGYSTTGAMLSVALRRGREYLKDQILYTLILIAGELTKLERTKSTGESVKEFSPSGEFNYCSIQYSLPATASTKEKLSSESKATRQLLKYAQEEACNATVESAKVYNSVFRQLSNIIMKGEYYQ